MEGRNLIVAARRGAGLTQAELATRLGRAQPTISAWESGRQRPSFEAVFEAVRACGQELAVGLPNSDDSYNSLIRGQLRLSATERIRSLTETRGIDAPQILADLIDAGIEMVLVGRVAGAVNGWPITLDDLRIEVVPASLPALRQAAKQLGFEHVNDAQWTLTGPFADRRLGQAQWILPANGRLIAHEQPPRTRGYADLARTAERLEVAGAPLPVASLIDLIRTAEGDPYSTLRPFVSALWSTLEMTQRVRAEEELATRNVRVAA